MSMADAFWLASRIQNKVPGVTVMAVGMFLRVEDIRDDSPWKVLVTAAGLTKPRVMMSEGDLRMFVAQMHKEKAAMPDGMLF